MRKNGKFLLAGVFALLAVLMLVLVLFVDVAAIGPEGTKVGLSSINKLVHEKIGVNMKLYDITEYLGYLTLLVAACFGALGLWQMIKRKSFFKVDRDILLLGGLYVIVLAIYVFFEKVIVNYRPVIMPDTGVPEASFPSTHTMLAITILGSAILVIGKYVKNQALCVAIKTALAGLMAAIVVGRFVSGVHWFSDIVTSIFLSTALLLLFCGIRESWRKPYWKE